MQFQLSSRLAAFRRRYIVAQPQRLEIRFFGTHIRADGIGGIIGAIMIFSVVMAVYFGN
jgi:hypothetical protein